MFTSIINLRIFVCYCLMILPLVPLRAGQLDNYIRYAFEHNAAVQQNDLNLDKAMLALQEARGYYLPNVSFNGMYTLAKGGRTIDLPVGDMLNPVYSTLNRLTASQNFPQIENQSVQFNPNNFYDVKLRTTMPLINFEIGHNKSIRKESISYRKAAGNVYKRALVRDIKTAYFHYIQAKEALKIYESGANLAAEHIRVNESLLKNGVSNITVVTRARAEAQKTASMITEQQNRVSNAQAYFNFLLNRALDTEILEDSIDAVRDRGSSTPQQREELFQLDKMRQIYELNEAVYKSNKIPKLNAFLDLGAQDFNFRVNDKSLYLLGGVNLQWDLFTGNKTNARIRQAKADKAIVDKQYEEADQAIRLQQLQAENDVHTAEKKLLSSRAQMELMERYYHDQLKLYKEGRLLYIELLDAQTQWIAAQITYTLGMVERRIALAAFEYSTASYNL